MGVEFNIKNALLRVFYQKTISIIVILSIAIGMIFPLAAFAMGNDTIENMKATKFVDVNHTAIAEFLTFFEEKDRMDSKIKYLAKKMDAYGYFAHYQGVITWKDQDLAGSVAGTTLSYFKLENYIMIQGKMFSKEQEERGELVCLLKKDGALWKKGAKVGDMIQLNGTKFKIIGAIRDPKIYGSIVIPYNSLSKFLKNNHNKIQYKALLHTKETIDVDEIIAKIKQNESISILSVISAIEGQQVFFDSAKEVMINNILLGLFVLLFAIISFIFIIAGKVSEEQYSIGVKMAVGASQKVVFVDLLIQSVILITISIILDILFFPIVRNLMPQLGFVIDWKIIVIMIIIGFLLAFLVSGIVFKILIKKKRVYELIKEKS